MSFRNRLGARNNDGFAFCRFCRSLSKELHGKLKESEKRDSLKWVSTEFGGESMGKNTMAPADSSVGDYDRDQEIDGQMLFAAGTSQPGRGMSRDTNQPWGQCYIQPPPASDLVALPLYWRGTNVLRKLFHCVLASSDPLTFR